MTILEEQHSDAAVPQLAVEALNAASRRARRAGHTLVFVRDGQLVRQTAAGVEILRAAPEPMKVLTLVQTAK